MNILGPAIAILRLILCLAGIGFMIASLRHITDNFPGYASGVKHHRSLWSYINVRSWYTPKGFRLDLTGFGMIATAVLLGFVFD